MHHYWKGLEFKQAVTTSINPTSKISNINPLLCEYKLNTLGEEKRGRWEKQQEERERGGSQWLVLPNLSSYSVCVQNILM